MPTRRKPGDPWYTVIYREPHSLFWAPSVLTFALVFVIDRFGFNASIAESALWGAIVAAAQVTSVYVFRRLDTR